ncbi:MAG: hypothetical protein IPP72_05400 [Chitinophagaceae bacterium]|nr:hypothetical protein [Chitinophagaceae bacterium]
MIKLPASFTEKKIVTLANVFLLIFFAPFFIIGKNSYVPLGDNFESVVIWIKVLMNQGAYWKGPTFMVDQVMNGLPRALYGNQLNIPTIIIAYAGTFWGYIADLLLIAFSGFWGMYLLIKTHFADKFNNDYFLIAFISVMYALLPYWSFDLSVSAQPLLFYAFFNLRKKQLQGVSFLIIFLFPFFTSLVLVGVFDCIVLSFFLVRDLTETKKINLAYFGGLALLTVMYLLANYQLVYFTVAGHYTSHRIEMVKAITKDFSSMIKTFVEVTVNLQWHSPALQAFVLLPVVAIISLLFLFRNRNAKQASLFKWLLLYILLCNVFYAANYSHYCDSIFAALFKVLPIQLQRFHFLEPFVWYMAFGLGLAWISVNVKKGKLIATGLCLLQLLFLSVNHPSVKNIAGRFIAKDGPTFNRLTGEGIFTEVADFIGKPKDQYRVASVGLYPSMAQWNGFYTLDGYMPDYPITYKHEFRQVIANELDKGNYKTYFDQWGSKCYLYINEVKDNLSDYAKNRPYYNKGIENPDLNFDQFLKMGGRYIISSIPITSTRMLLLKKFTRADAWYDIYLYEVK